LRDWDERGGGDAAERLTALKVGGVGEKVSKLPAVGPTRGIFLADRTPLIACHHVAQIVPAIRDRLPQRIYVV
jgi:hypothetical protein